MINRVRLLMRKIILGYKSSSQDYIEHYRKMGARIGAGTVVFQPLHTCIDETRPFLIDIGDNVQITRGVTILTHGYDWSVLKGTYGRVLGSAGKVIIGNNVFIGVNTTILKGVTIGDNVIVGAGSLVNKDLPANTVCAGNPARVIMSIEEYLKKRLDQQLKEAKCVYDEYIAVYKKEPREEVFNEFFWLFQPRNQPLNKEFIRQMNNVGNYDYSTEVFKKSKAEFADYNEFLKYLRES